eukprot:scaffold10350_cov68-Phaeocystis_antarctica.AAC.4
MRASLTLASSSVRLAASRRSRRCCALRAWPASSELLRPAGRSDGAALLLEPNAAGQAWPSGGAAPPQPDSECCLSAAAAPAAAEAAPHGGAAA